MDLHSTKYDRYQLSDAKEDVVTHLLQEAIDYLEEKRAEHLLKTPLP